MRKATITAALLIAGTYITCSAQQASTDSTQVARTFYELLHICRNVDFGDPKTSTVGMFYKAGKYVVYRGDDEKRKWKDTTNYLNPAEKEQVDAICLRINGALTQASAYTIIGYHTEKESEGTWHGLTVRYTRKGVTKNGVFAFLKVKGVWALGDID